MPSKSKKRLNQSENEDHKHAREDEELKEENSRPRQKKG